MSAIPHISDADVAGKRLLVRADLNVPVIDGTITDTTRIDRFAAGMRPLLARGARLIVLTHRGRPKATFDKTLSNEILQPALAEALGVEVGFSPDTIGRAAEDRSGAVVDGEVLLMENVRFLPGETENAPNLARAYAALADLFVNDAFSSAHRAHASTEGVAKYLPPYAGPLMLEELGALSRALENPGRPAVAIVGGAKVSSKIEVLKHLVQKLDTLIIGGGMANTFLLADGAPMGKSLHEADLLETVADIRALAWKHGCEILLPRDVVVARAFEAGAASDVVDSHSCPDDAMILDAGPKSVETFKEALGGAKTVLWNGPLGAFEMPPFDRATVALAQAASDLTADGRIVSVAGGGDTVAALNTAGVSGTFSYVSTAGGAFLEWIEGRVLPGVAALTNQNQAA